MRAFFPVRFESVLLPICLLSAAAVATDRPSDSPARVAPGTPISAQAPIGAEPTQARPAPTRVRPAPPPAPTREPAAEGSPAIDSEALHHEVPGDAYLPGRPGLRPLAGLRQSVITRGPYTSVQVNVDEYGNNIPNDAANEPSIAVDPLNPSRMAIGWRQFDSIASDFRQAGWGYTTDGGHHWTFPGAIDPGVFHSDPVLASDTQGNFYYNSLLADGGDMWCVVYKSVNGGATWDDGVYAYGGDKQWMAIDLSDGLGRDNLYAYWSLAFTCPGCNGHFSRSYDGGQSWRSPTNVPGNPFHGTVVVGPDGELYAAGRGFVVAKSTTMWDSSAPAQWDFSTIVDLDGSGVQGGGPNPGGLLGQVWVATDNSDTPTRGNVYLLCSVDRFSTTDPLDVMFARSTDGGQTWSSPVRVNDDAEDNGAYQWFSTMSVAPDGRIDVIWLDTRGDPGGYDSELYYSYSLDAGETWLQNVPLSPPFDPHVGWPQQNKMGDYFHMVSDELGANLAYAATFNGEQDVYFLRIGTFDCNGNGIDDADDIMAGTSTDCDGNAVPDECGPYHDCNYNGVRDACDISEGTSDDCALDGVPDECEPDCDRNGTADSCDILNCPFGGGMPCSDCNINAIPDGCEVARIDCNGNGVPDDCDASLRDCNSNGVPDDCDAVVHDCNLNTIPDSCDIGAGTSADCSPNGIPDECEPDCNTNSIADSCDLAFGTSRDCNGNGIPDECDVAAGVGADANHNGILDSCDDELCDSNGLWDAFPRSSPPALFHVGQLIEGVDYIPQPAGDGIAWDNNGSNTASVEAYGCEAGDEQDLGLTVRVPAGDAPEEGRLTSEYFRTVDGELDCGAALYTLAFRGRLQRSSSPYMEYNPRTDWQILVYDARLGMPVAQVELVSTISDRYGNFVPGHAMLRRGTSGSVFADTGFELESSLWYCMDFRIELDNRDSSVTLTINDAFTATAALPPGSYRMDYLVVRAVLNGNGATAGNDTAMQLDKFDFCTQGDVLSEWPDCNDNCIADYADITNGVSRDCDLDGTPDECASVIDCNLNALPDFCDIYAGTSLDCNGNAIPDDCEPDCNYTLIPDDCDITGGTSNDCTGNGVPDECEPDCNHTGVADVCEIAAGSSEDCNGNGVPDECDVVQLDCNTNGLPDDCDISAETSRDCNNDGVPDECDPTTPDCNTNGVPDACDVSEGTSEDCSGNGIPDECEPDCDRNGTADVCEIAAGTGEDCNDNGALDSCDLAEGTSADCNTDDVPDECQIAGNDCNDNQIPDECDVAQGTSDDCNHNDTSDTCDILRGESYDCNENGTPDECEEVSSFEILHVDMNASGSGDGGTWEDALPSLRAALCLARSNPGVREVRVAQGRYTPAGPVDDRTASFELSERTVLLGGYAGNSQPNPANRDPVAYPTILSGDLNGDDGPGFANNAENSYHVVVADSVDDSAVLDGFVITGGNANHGNAPHDSGGGLRCELASPILIDCVFRANSTANSGGGMACYANANPRLSGCDFIGNAGELGAGLYVQQSSPALDDCLFHGNQAGIAGGMCAVFAAPVLTHCVFENNDGGEVGGGFLCQYGLGSDTPALVNCFFRGNTADYGGALCNGQVSVEAVNCVFSGNNASFGGAVLGFGGASTGLINCTFAGNQAIGSGGAVGSAGEAYPTLVNCIVWDNSNPQVSTGGSIVRYSCIQGGWSGVGNINTDPGFRDADGADGLPGTSDDDLRLTLGSPCVDAGNTASVPHDAHDLDGDGDTIERMPWDHSGGPRVLDDPDVPDTGVADPPAYPAVVDMGAYEFPKLARMVHSVPADGRSLWRTSANLIRLTFDDDIALPPAGVLRIAELLPDGQYGDDLVANFDLVIDAEGDSSPRGLRVVETVPCLTHRTWIAVRTVGEWPGVKPFLVHYRVMVGDVDDDGRVKNLDASGVFANVSPDPVADSRYDVDGDGYVSEADATAIYPYVSLHPAPAKPTGH